MLKIAFLSTILAAAFVSPALSADTMAPAASTNTTGAAAKLVPAFTQQQARTHLVRQGYKNISVLTRNNNGSWMGTAEKSGKTLIVAVRL